MRLYFCVNAEVSKILKSCTKSTWMKNSNTSSQRKFKVLKSIQWQSAAWYILVIYVIARFSSQTAKGIPGLHKEHTIRLRAKYGQSFFFASIFPNVFPYMSGFNSTFSTQLNFFLFLGQRLVSGLLKFL